MNEREISWENTGSADSYAENAPRVFIVGGGFAGIECAKALAGTPARVTLLDRRNHHVFQPLLYQVATAALSPADIAAPIRHVLRDQLNCRVVLTEVKAIEPARKRIVFEEGAVEYDWLVLAGGATHSYFGHDEWAPLAPGLKSLEDATEIRRRILLAFETAEYEGSEERRRADLTFVIVGGGATGVELAGAIMEIAAKTIPEDFRFIDTKTTRVILFQGEERLLTQFSPELSERAKQALESLGVEVRLEARVTGITEMGVHIGEEFVAAGNVFWAAGVKGNPLGQSLGVPLDLSGRVKVDAHLQPPGCENVFVVGDMAAVQGAAPGALVPGVAPAAVQMGQYVGKLIHNGIVQKKHIETARNFRYRDKGSLATIGRARAVAEIGCFKFSGLFAWLLWAGVHIAFLIGFRNRFVVLLNWVWNWLFMARGARLIMGPARLELHSPEKGER